MKSTAFTPQERITSISLAGVFSLRMFGMFVVLPVLSLYVSSFDEVDGLSVGFAIGVYGLTQAIFQVPFGRLSDSWGRKNTIYVGLIIFALGSVIAALASNALVLCLGRAVQGAGAISSVVIALNADLTRDVVRTKSMAIIGIAIGITFMVSIVLGPLLGALIGVRGIFILTAVLTVFAGFVIRMYVPDPPEQIAAGPLGRGVLSNVLKNPQLNRLNFGIFSLHGILMATFVVVPFQLRLLIDEHNTWMVYFFVMLTSVLVMFPLMLLSERKGKSKEAFLISICSIALACLALYIFQTDIWALGICLVAFFAGFNLLEATLPSLVSKIADTRSKGTALGVYSSSQYVGTFLGGATGGLILDAFGNKGVFLFCGLWAGIWIVIAAGSVFPRGEFPGDEVSDDNTHR